jgi:hypothetical protein
MKSSLHSLIPLLPFLLSHLRLPTFSILFLCSQAHILASYRLEIQLTLLNWNLLCNYIARTTQKTQPLYCWESLFTAPLHSNGSSLIVDCVFVTARISFPSRCLTANVYSYSDVMSQYDKIAACISIWVSARSTLRMAAGRNMNDRNSTLLLRQKGTWIMRLRSHRED